MAANVRTELDSDLGISFTGVAGPDEQEGKPAGTVFIGISYRDGRSHVEEIHLSGSRAQIRIRTVKYGCHYLIRDIQQFSERAFFLKLCFSSTDFHFYFLYVFVDFRLILLTIFLNRLQINSLFRKIQFSNENLL